MTAIRRALPASFLPVSGLLTAALTWGTIWYPYRLLQAAGLSGVLSTLATYVLALALGAALFYRQILPPGATLGARRWAQLGWLLAVALASGWTNLAYVLAVIKGEVMRVLLLFYLAPLWTVLLARLLLREHTNHYGYLVIGLSVAGAMVMLHAGRWGLPIPATEAEWLGLSAGMAFALGNVLSRHLRHIPLGTRTVWVLGGVVLVAGVWVSIVGGAGPALGGLKPVSWAWLAAVGVILMVATVAVQYGLAHTPANRAIVILLLELLVGALSSWYLAGEVMGPREWLGGAMIVAASLFSGRMEHHV